MLETAPSRLWGSTRSGWCSWTSSRSTTAGVRFLRRTQRRDVPSELTRLCPASPRRVGWVPAGKGQRRVSSGADGRVITRTKTFHFSNNRRRRKRLRRERSGHRDRRFFCISTGQVILQRLVAFRNTLLQETARVEGHVWVKTRTSVQLAQESCSSVVKDFPFQCMPRRIGGRRKAHSCRQVRHSPPQARAPKLCFATAPVYERETVYNWLCHSEKEA